MDGHIPADEPDHRRAGRVVLERYLGSRGNGDVRVFENDRPFLRVIDAFAGVGGVILIPDSGRSLGEIDDRVFGDVERPIGAIGSGNDDVSLQKPLGGEEGTCKAECGVFHDIR